MNMDEYRLDWIIAEGINQKKMVIEIKQEVKSQFDITNVELENLINEHLEGYRIFKWCEKLGHNLVVHSYGGPEGGGESGFCKRCHWSFDHTYF